MHKLIIPDVIQEHPVRSLARTNNAYEAAIAMKKSNIGAILIIDKKGKLEGIVTERDLTCRVIAADKAPKKTLLADIMTADPKTLAPSDSADDALEMMRRLRFRHLPVSQNDKLMGVVSIRDLYSVVKSGLEDNIRETEAFVFGDRYGA
jgi:signal-transduction protein with cAMP-binding, CBS, and nucleotidyltransferase domain